MHQSFETTGPPPPRAQAGEMRGRSLYTSCSEVSCEIVEGLHSICPYRRVASYTHIRTCVLEVTGKF